MIGARATKRRMVHGKSSEAEVGPAQERKIPKKSKKSEKFLKIQKIRKFQKIAKNCKKFQARDKICHMCDANSNGIFFFHAGQVG